MLTRTEDTLSPKVVPNRDNLLSKRLYRIPKGVKRLSY